MPRLALPRALVAPLLLMVLVTACSLPTVDGLDSGAAAAQPPAPTTAATPTASVPSPSGVPAVGADPSSPQDDPADSLAEDASVSPDPPTVAAPTEAPLPEGVARPEWLHTRPLTIGPDGYALSEPTPEELVVRRIPTIDILPPPPDGTFDATVQPLSDEVVARSTWTPECPASRDELRYVQASFWGFDERPHTGEMIVNAAWAEEVVDVFRRLYEIRYPIEEMRVVNAAELDGIPTGDTNNTTAFVCRPVRGATTWSQHAYGLAVDINPFINPYRRGDRILPELASAYLDRDHGRPGMLAEGHVAVEAFDALGWGWGGRWNSLIDWMHFSANGR